MNLVEFGVWVIHDGMGMWDSYPTLEEAVLNHGGELIYKISATPVGKFQVKTELVRVEGEE